MKDRVIKISAGMTGEFEVIKTDAVDRIIEKQLAINSILEEEGKVIDDPYGIIKEYGYKIDLVGCQDNIDLDEIIIDVEFDYYDYFQE